MLTGVSCDMRRFLKILVAAVEMLRYIFVRHMKNDSKENDRPDPRVDECWEDVMKHAEEIVDCIRNALVACDKISDLTGRDSEALFKQMTNGDRLTDPKMIYEWMGAMAPDLKPKIQLMLREMDRQKRREEIIRSRGLTEDEVRLLELA